MSPNSIIESFLIFRLRLADNKFYYLFSIDPSHTVSCSIRILLILSISNSLPHINSFLSFPGNGTPSNMHVSSSNSMETLEQEESNGEDATQDNERKIAIRLFKTGLDLFCYIEGSKMNLEL